MSDKNERETRLRTLLREGDPAADGQSPSPERMREMRRLVLGSLAERRQRRHRRLLLVASAATALLALALGLALHREIPPPVPRPVESPVAARALPLQLPAVPAAATPILPIALPAPLAAAERRAPVSGRSHHRFAVATAVRPEEKVEEPPATPLQIQFNTPGGTRVIWVLDRANRP
jgi:hypothetical protein